nr:T9SS type A sorting domain-containing protein [Bacteroidota bacterium]
IAGPDSVPHGNDTVLIGSAIGGSSNYSYSWSPAAYIVGSTTQQNCTTISIATQITIILTVTDNVTGCIDTTSITIFPFGGPLQGTATASPDTICAGTTTQLDILAFGGTSIYSYSWASNPIGFTSSIQNPVVAPTVTTTYSVTVIDGNDTINSSIVVNVTAAPSVSFSGLSATYCASQAADSLIGVPAGGTFTGPGINGNWFDPTVAGTGNHTITYTYILNGCSGTNMQGVSVTAAPIASAGNDIILPCGAPGQPIGSSTVWGMLYSWTPTTGLNNPHISNPVAQPLLTTLYTLTVLDTASGCSATDDILITVTGGPNLIVSSDTTICFGSAVILTASGGTSYIWSTNDTTASIVAILVISSVYTVTAYSSGGCAASDTIFVDVNNPVVNLGNDIYTLPSQSVLLDAGSGFTAYLWSTGDTTQTILVDSTGIGPNNPTFFSVTVTDNIGCQDSDTVEVTFVMGIEDVNKQINISLFPNPTKGLLTISITDYTGSNLSFEITDITGRLISSERLKINNNKTIRELDLSSYPKGVYFIRFQDDNLNKTEKIIIQ